MYLYDQQVRFNRGNSDADPPRRVSLCCSFGRCETEGKKEKEGARRRRAREEWIPSAINGTYGFRTPLFSAFLPAPRPRIADHRPIPKIRRAGAGAGASALELSAKNARGSIELSRAIDPSYRAGGILETRGGAGRASSCAPRARGEK